MGERSPLTAPGAGNTVADMLIGPKCVLCAKPGRGLCAACVVRLRPHGDDEVQHILGVPTGSIFRYEAVARHVVTGLKFDGKRDAVPALGVALGVRVAALAGDEPINAVTWVPSLPLHVRGRGFDQGALLAEATARSLGIPNAPMLRRADGQGQTGHSRAERLRGPTLVARRPNRRWRGDRVVIVDDVITTGSSMRNAIEALRRAGLEPVAAVVLAARRNDGNARL